MNGLRDSASELSGKRGRKKADESEFMRIWTKCLADHFNLIKRYDDSLAWWDVSR